MTTRHNTLPDSGTPLVSGAIERLKSDTHLAMLCVFGMIGSQATGSFAVYRLIHGDTIMALADALLVAVMLGGVAYAWKTGRNVMAANMAATLLSAGVLFLIPALDLSYMWLFSLMVAVFLMASSRVAILLSLVLIVVVGSTPDLFAGHIERLTFIAVAAQVTLFSVVFAWRISRQHGQLDIMASLDPLTGIGNRRALQREIATRAEAARIGGDSAGLAVIDLDHFKDVNDRHGHDAGDQVLLDLVGIVNDTMRDSDSFYRYGGEEFVLVMPGTSTEGIAAALGKLQAAIRERLRAPDDEPITVSIGAAALNADDDPGQWLTRADHELYTAKTAGRDHICIDHDP